MKWTMILMTLASVALAGIWPLAGFFSKDKILEVAFSGEHYILWGTLWVTAGLTAFYSFRLIMLAFFGEERHLKFGIHPHEAYKYMLWAMSPLAVLAVVAGWFEHQFVEFVTVLLPNFEFHTHHVEAILIAVTSMIALGGILTAIIMYKNGPLDTKYEKTFLYKLFINQYYIPQLYEELFVKTYRELSTIFWKQIDMKIVDATVDGVASILYKTGDGTRGMQSGNLSTNLKWMVLGLVVLLSLVIVFIVLNTLQLV